VNRLQFITLAVALSLIITISAILVARTVVMRTRYRRHVAINAMTAAASGRGTRSVLPLLPAAADSRHFILLARHEQALAQRNRQCCGMSGCRQPPILRSPPQHRTGQPSRSVISRSCLAYLLRPFPATHNWRRSNSTANPARSTRCCS